MEAVVLGAKLLCNACGWVGNDPQVIELGLKDSKVRYVEDVCPKCGSPDLELI